MSVAVGTATKLLGRIVLILTSASIKKFVRKTLYAKTTLETIPANVIQVMKDIFAQILMNVLLTVAVMLRLHAQTQ